MNSILEEAGQSFQVTRERIRQIEAKALRKLPAERALRLVHFSRSILNAEAFPMATIVNCWSVLAVRDLALSTRYYMEVLGFTKEPINGPGWSFLSRDSFRIMLGECVDERPAGELGNHSYFAYWNIEGVDDLYQEFVAKGAIVTSKPTNKPWGLREFSLSTPDGHRIVCGETL